MTDTGTDVIVRQSRAARRLGRLFKIERGGGFDRRPAATVRRLVERRGRLVTELLLLDGVRRSLPSPGSAELDLALRELAREVQRSRRDAEARMQWLDMDLRLRRGEGVPTGVRDAANGRLLGRG